MMRIYFHFMSVSCFLSSPQGVPPRKVRASAPGYRSDANGTLHFVCSYGYVWSSKTNNIRSHNLHFSAPWLNPSYAYYRANGYQLRCLSE
ncbi:hypothetical protein [uncultured Rikenella sp.]|uniref:hypothetical protein n=2 Tax=uncultured Rikenella sp. TaxID=368003 RepID=UPI002606D02F|nr:hypothetical protein [uncultured Rikenella sp.]